MKILIALVLGSFLALSSAYPSSTKEGRIIGGSDAKRHQFTYMVSVQRNGGLWCGGTIISTTWVVSAAHCFETPEFRENLTAAAGLLHLGENHPDVQTIPVIEVINHPEYIHKFEDIVDNDISLLNLASPLSFTVAVQPAVLPPPSEQPSGKAWFSGWGVYQLPSTEPTTLQCLEMPLITKKECEHRFTKVPQPYQLLDTMFCVAPPIKSETGCFGDSGGPLVQNGMLIGVTSWGSTGCGFDGAPTVFTQVSLFIDFITKHVKNN